MIPFNCIFSESEQIFGMLCIILGHSPTPVIAICKILLEYKGYWRARIHWLRVICLMLLIGCIILRYHQTLRVQIHNSLSIYQFQWPFDSDARNMRHANLSAAICYYRQLSQICHHGIAECLFNLSLFFANLFTKFHRFHQFNITSLSFAQLVDVPCPYKRLNWIRNKKYLV